MQFYRLFFFAYLPHIFASPLAENSFNLNPFDFGENDDSSSLLLTPVGSMDSTDSSLNPLHGLNMAAPDISGPFQVSVDAGNSAQNPSDLDTPTFLNSLLADNPSNPISAESDLDAATLQDPSNLDSPTHLLAANHKDTPNKSCHVSRIRAALPLHPRGASCSVQDEQDYQEEENAGFQDAQEEAQKAAVDGETAARKERKYKCRNSQPYRVCCWGAPYRCVAQVCERIDSCSKCTFVSTL